MKRYSRRLRKIGLKAKVLLSNGLAFLLFISCTKESINIINIENTDLPSPLDLLYESSIVLDVKQFSPEKIICDIKGNIYISGNRRRLILVKDNREVEEMNIQEIYPCEILDIDTDGFDIFLLDRMNRKIWTVKREKVLEKGFALESRPLFFSVSENGLFTVIYSNRREFYIFSRTEKRFSGFLLEEGVMEGDGGAILFRKNSIYFANKKKDRVEFSHLYNPSKRLFLDVKSPSSLAIDRWENLFVASQEGIVFITKDGKGKRLLSKEMQMAKISISKEKIYILNLEEKKIDVFKIIYTSTDSNISEW